MSWCEQQHLRGVFFCCEGGRLEGQERMKNMRIRPPKAFSLSCHTHTCGFVLYFRRPIWFYHWTLQWQINVFLTINRFVDLGKETPSQGWTCPFVKLWLFLQRHLYRTHGTTWWLKWKAMMTGRYNQCWWNAGGFKTVLKMLEVYAIMLLYAFCTNKPKCSERCEQG